MTDSQYRTFKAGILLGVAICFSILVRSGVHFLDELKGDARQAKDDMHLAASNLQSLALSVDQAGVIENQHLDAELQETRKATADIHDLAAHTDINLNGKNGILRNVNDDLIPHVVNLLDSSNTAILGAGGRIDSVGLAASQSVSKVGPLLDALTVRVDDPRYDSIVTSVDGIAKQGNATMVNVTKESNIIVAQTEKAVAPKNKFLAIVQGIAGGTLTVAELAYYLGWSKPAI